MTEQVSTGTAGSASAESGYEVDRVVICDAFVEPHQHYQLLPGGKSKLTPGRRPSVRYLASARSAKGGIAGILGKQTSLLEDLLLSGAERNDKVNQLREEIKAWRSAGYPAASMTTTRLLEWWFERADERQAQGKRFFYCQQEAIETVIYLYEARKRQVMPDTGDLIRYALKLATGTGKTLVMAMLVVWSSVHSRKVVGSTLSSNFLILVPNLTVRDRVWGTDPFTKLPTGSGLDPDSPENLFKEFDLVPPEFSEFFQPNITVRNWQSIPLEADRDDWVSENLADEGRFVPASVIWSMQRRMRADPRNALRKVLGKFRDVVVLNDEAHHVYGEKRAARDEDPAYIKWSRIIDLLSQTCRLALVVDVSATPWYGSGSPKPDGTLFEWLVSDFSVYDAFESGLVKVVRLPDPDGEGHRYLDLWDQVSGSKTKQEYISACKGAIAVMYASWLDAFQEWESYLEPLRPGPPPVMLFIADRAERAKWLFEHATSDFDLLRNDDEDDVSTWATIQVDSRVFDAEKGREALLREMVNSVGRKGKAGADVRCIVSVNMLSEGWDVKNVTHILGLRAFQSPLLTEQIIGRGLRRVDYTVLNAPIQERLQNPNRPDEETVDAFGIPFIGFPVERKKRAKMKGWLGTSVPIKPDPAKAQFAIELPNIRAWAIGVSKPLTEMVDVRKLTALRITKQETPTEVLVKPVVGGKPEEVLTLDLFRKEFPLLRSKFALAHDLWVALGGEGEGLLSGPTFDESLEFVTAYVDQRVQAVAPSRIDDFGIYYWRQRALDILQTALQDAPTDAITVPIPSEPPYYSTGSVPEFLWPGLTSEGKKCHWQLVPCHTPLEQQFAAFLDSAADVDRYIKNERIGFSVTYYDAGRPRQYFPDFVVVARDADKVIWWLVETKGEIRPNTHVKRLAAELWCDRMSRSGSADWRHLFVEERALSRHLKAGVNTLSQLAAALK